MKTWFFLAFIIGSVAIPVLVLLGIFKKDKVHYKRAGIAAIVAVASFVGFIATADPPDETKAEEPETEEVVVEESEKEEAKDEEVEEVEDEPEEEVEEAPREHRNALNSANDYLAFSAFSEKGLAKQLDYEGYPEDAVNYAIENVEVDYYEQALQVAKDYLDFSSFSDEGLKEQLIYEGYSDDQAQYAIDNLD